jgi:hypothetical protein
MKMMQRRAYFSAVIPALGAGIHALGFEESKAWIPGPSPGMTTEWEACRDA